MKKISVKAVARDAKRAEKKIRAEVLPPGKALPHGMGVGTADSFVNYEQKMGIGADNALSSSTYGFNPITRIRTVLEWIHRGSWLGGVAIDVVADDMTKAGVELKGDIKPDDIEALEECAVDLSIWNAINENIKWSRLYGGSIAVIMIDGQKMDTPLLTDRIGKGAFQGLAVFDRWMVEPSLDDLVADPGPALGLPKYYRTNADSPALRNVKIHYTRCIRLDGIKLPYWQRVQENLWGISTIERLYDRMVAFDSATTGAAQLVYKSYIRSMKIKGFRELISTGGEPLDGLVRFMQMVNRFQGIEGLTVIDMDDEFATTGTDAFSGLDSALSQFALQLSGALQIPMVRLFGQSPAGFNSGDSELRMYYDSIKQQQEKTLKVGVTQIYRCMAQSLGIKLKKGFKIEFRNLWQLDEVQKADVATKIADTITKYVESGLMADKTGMQEIKQSAHVTGVGTNITEEQINAADDVPVPSAEAAMELGAELAPDVSEEETDNPSGGKKKKPGDKPSGKEKPKTPSKDGAVAVLDEAPVPVSPMQLAVNLGGVTVNNTPQGITLPTIHVEPAAVTVQPATIQLGDVHVAPAAVSVAPANIKLGDNVVNVPKGDTVVNVEAARTPNVTVNTGETNVKADIHNHGKEATTKTIVTSRDPAEPGKMITKITEK